VRLSTVNKHLGTVPKSKRAKRSGGDSSDAVSGSQEKPAEDSWPYGREKVSVKKKTRKGGRGEDERRMK
jgi:hypothetical protein